MSIGIFPNSTLSNRTRRFLCRNHSRRSLITVLVALSGCISVEPATPFQTSDVDSLVGQDDTPGGTIDSKGADDTSGSADTKGATDVNSGMDQIGGDGGDACDSPSPCPNVGVCSEGVVSACIDGQWTCDLSQVSAYEADEETSCDNLDNDCDGETDEFLFDPATSDCPQQGVCTKGLFAFCLEGIWHCDYTNVPSYESKEISCDNKDNDCDGITDEGTFNAESAGCKTVGVCAGKSKALCEGGQPQCDYSAVGSLYETTEESCDGLDNDCDGQTDEVFVVGVTESDCTPDAPSKGPCCDSVGVCVGKVNATCAGGTWTCNYNAVLGFQASGETSCDGKDNDCDGLTDEPFNLDPTESGCATAGLCFGSVAKCIDNKWDCGFDNIVGYEVSETLCDGFDNDCDGVVDENISAVAGPDTTTCSDEGICNTGVPVVCVNGTWLCNPSTLPSHEVEETLCDGLDNDCDGQVDETVSDPPETVPNCEKLGVGVCNAETSIACIGGEYVCNWGINPLYEDPEITCDGKDNDCDGKIDEDLEVLPAGTCPSLGVCSEGVAAACSNGQWVCDFVSVIGYEADESTCDAKDNDCDGLIDENLTEIASSACKQVGVCANGVKTTCVAGDWLCDYSGIPDYSGADEYVCDGKDNDCDGTTDEDTCIDGTSCTADTICASGFCAFTLDNPSGLCSDGSQCAQSTATPEPLAILVPEGTATCADTHHISTCDGGTWTPPTLCSADAAYCVQGKCSLCLPGQTMCDGLIGTKVCNSTGTEFDDGPTCKAGLVCVGSGVCVVPGEQPASTNLTANQSSPAIARLNQQGFVVAWSHDGNIPDKTPEIRFRQFGPDGQPSGVETQVSAQSGFSDHQPAIAANPTGWLLGWQRTANLTSDTSGWVRPYSLSGSALGAETPIALPKEDQFGLAEQITISTLGTAYLATWAAPMTGLAGFDIFSRRFDATGAPVGNPTPLTGLAAGDQNFPTSTTLSDGTVVVAWQSTSTSGAQVLMAVRLSGTGTIMGQPVTLTDTNSGKAGMPAAVATDDGLFVVYEFTPPGATESSIRGRFYNMELQPQGAFLDISAKSPGIHRNPSIAGVTSTGFGVVYESIGPDTNAVDLVLRRFTPLGVPTATPVNPCVETDGDQLDASVLAYDDGRLVIVWTNLVEKSGNAAEDVRFRVIGFY